MHWGRAAWYRLLSHLLALAPLLVLAWAYRQGRLGVDPLRAVLLRTGLYALILLIASLVPTVLSALFRIRAPLRFRRMLGLYAFAYAALHLLIFVGPYYHFAWYWIWLAIVQGRTVIVGLASFIILVPLAFTSTDAAVQRLGRNWQRLHRLTYLAAALAVLHYVWVYKEIRWVPILYGAALGLLLILRIPAVVRLLARTSARD
jgi:methionine sulfoxide reductase heme-binding subunit